MNELRRTTRFAARQNRLLLLAGLLLGSGVRLYRLGGESLWYDETVSVHLARLPLAEMLARTAGDIHPPGYYALLHLWQGVARPSLAHGLEFLFAWPSLALGLLALPLLYALGRRLFGERTGLAALWLAAINPFAVWYSQEVRMYTLGAALGLLCLWAVVQFTGLRRSGYMKVNNFVRQGQRRPSGESPPIENRGLAQTKPTKVGWRVPSVAYGETTQPVLTGFAFHSPRFSIGGGPSSGQCHYYRMKLLTFIQPDMGGERAGVSRRVDSPTYGGGWLFVYVVAAAAGLYTLYYFLFLLLALNLLVPLLLWLHEKDGAQRRRAITRWLLAQLVVLLLWLPWLPTFWRQATDPPVPPWRSGWDSPAALLHSLNETFAALLVGQTPPAEQTWPWAILVALLLIAFLALLFWRGRQMTGDSQERLSAAVVLLYVFIPVAVLYAATLAGSPIYHVRYLATYAPPFLLVPAVVLVAAWRRARWLGAALGVGLLALSAFALVEFWTNPLYRADDHRAAVAELAQAWRPGDAILLNAGWITPVLTTYWPTELLAADAGLPPLPTPVRLLDYAQWADALPSDTPPVIRTGSVDGPPALGWGDPASDFFPISRAQTTAGLQALAGQARRIWHYRLYDTVSDPDGVIRAWLAEHTQLMSEKPIPGRDFGLVQLFETEAWTPALPSAAPLGSFGGALTLAGASTPPTVTAGDYLYTDLVWEALPPLAALPADLSTSLRLYNAAGQQIAQADGPPAFLPTRGWEVHKPYRQAAALPVPANLPPGIYSLQLIVYRQDTAEALTVDGGEERSLELGKVQVQTRPEAGP